MSDVIDLNKERARRSRVPISSVISIIGIVSGPERGRLVTRGMVELGFPEIEVLNVPLWLHPAVTGIINEVADYIVNDGAQVKDGEKMLMEGPFRPFMFKFVEVDGEHILRIVDDHLSVTCTNPDCKNHPPGNGHDPTPA